MHSNRVSHFLASDGVPAAAPAGAAPTGFVVVPATFFAATQQVPVVGSQPDIYRIAREQALADARWSAIEKRLFSVWN